MKRPWHIWLGFAISLVVVLVAMGWISAAALRLDRAEAAARRDKALEECVRRCLWWIDSALAPLVAQESVRPPFAYRPFLPMDRAYTNMLNNRGGTEMLIASPLLTEALPNILVHFQYEPDGRLTSPQVPNADDLKLALSQHVTEAAIEEARRNLEKLGRLVTRQKLLNMLPENAPEPIQLVMSPLVQTARQLRDNRQAQFVPPRNDLGAKEYQQRNQVINNSANVMGQNQDWNTWNSLLLPPTDVSGVLMTPCWIDGDLILARRIAANGMQYVQGCLLDWPAIKASLLDTVKELLPEADLQPVIGEPDHEVDRMLAALPVRLIPGPLPPDNARAVSPIILSLAIAWGCVLLAALAVAGLLAAVIRLSERRASFVSAVTHELRTPLTTFQMYAEMLAEGMVADPGQQQQYLATLRAESGRLAHLVENVLSYARLERGRASGRIVSVGLSQLTDRVCQRLGERAQHAGMQLVVQRQQQAEQVLVQANLLATEQILFNLVDNACKYAAAAADKRIHLTLRTRNGAAEIGVRDHGPGISASARPRLFRPFSKSAQEAADTAPGVGLGLALSRRLARDMGGDLQVESPDGGGACFLLTLSTAPARDA